MNCEGLVTAVFRKCFFATHPRCCSKLLLNGEESWMVSPEKRMCTQVLLWNSLGLLAHER